jgi:hypothetical protein
LKSWKAEKVKQLIPDCHEKQDTKLHGNGMLAILARYVSRYHATSPHPPEKNNHVVNLKKTVQSWDKEVL